MLLTISGPSAVGKSFCVDYLCARYNFKTLVPFTSRQPRVSEAEGVHYHFRSKEDLIALSQNQSRGYWDTPLRNGDLYGYTDEVDELVEKPQLYVIQISARLALRIKQSHRERNNANRVILVFLNFHDSAVLEHKVRERFGDQYAERLAHAEQEISRSHEFDIRIAANDPFAAADKLVQELARRYDDLQLPDIFSPPVYGAMSDVDIIASLGEKEGIKFLGLQREDVINRIHGWSVDLTLGTRYWRVRSKQEFDLAFGSNEELEKRFESCLASEKGVVLGPGEFVLAVTHEHLQLPKGIVGIFAGRTSYANLGLSVELSQIILQPGHDSSVRIQVKNNLPYPLKLYPGMTLVQVVFFRLVSPASKKYIQRTEAHYKTENDVISKYYSDPVLKQIREQNPQKPFPWSAALEVAQIGLGISGVCALLAFVFGQTFVGRISSILAALLGAPVLVTRFLKFQQGGWR